MWQRDETRMLAQQSTREVAHIGVQIAGIEPVENRLFIDNPVAGEVEQDAALLHELDAIGVDHVLGRRKQRDMQADEVGASDEVIGTGGFLDL